MNRLNIISTVNEAYLFVWQNRQDLGLLAAPVALVLAIASALLGTLRPERLTGEPAFDPAMLLIVITFAAISVAAWIVFAVAWHRRCLVPDYGSTVREELRWRKRHSIFLGRTVLLGLLTIVVSALVMIPVSLLFASIGGAGGTIGALFLVALVLLIEARFMFVLPAASLDRRLGFIESWNQTEGNVTRIAAVLILTSIPISIAFAPIDWLLSSIMISLDLTDSIAALFVLTLIQSILGLIVTAFGVTGLSFCYRDLDD